MNFQKWLIKQQHRDDPIGDLAKDFIDNGKPKEFNIDYLKANGACEGAIDAYVEARNEYAKIGLYYE